MTGERWGCKKAWKAKTPAETSQQRELHWEDAGSLVGANYHQLVESQLMAYKGFLITITQETSNAG